MDGWHSEYDGCEIPTSQLGRVQKRYEPKMTSNRPRIDATRNKQNPEHNKRNPEHNGRTHALSEAQGSTRESDFQKLETPRNPVLLNPDWQSVSRH